MESLLGDVADSSQDAKTIEKSALIVRLSKSSESVSLWKRGLDLGREEVRSKDALLSHGGVGVRGVELVVEAGGGVGR